MRTATLRSRSRAVVGLYAAVAACLMAPVSAKAYTIVISNNLAGGDFYKTATVTKGKYKRYTAGYQLIVVPTDAADFNRTNPADFTTVDDTDHPVVRRNDKLGLLYTKAFATAGEGGGPGGKSIGTAKQFFNIGGTFKIVPEGKEAANGFVNLLAKGLIDGIVAARPINFGLSGASASFTATIFVEPLGTVTATRSVTSTPSQGVGVEASLSKDPGVKGGITAGAQQVKNGAAQNYHLLGKAPVNVALNWNFTMTLEAMNESGLISGYSAATSILQLQTLNLVPQSERHVLNKNDPFFSESVLRFDALTGALSIVHPEATNDVIELEVERDDSGVDGPAATVDTSGFVPEVDLIIDKNGDEPTADRLAHARLLYSGIELSGATPDGRIAFTDGTLQFLDQSTPSVLASATLTDIIADVGRSEFTATLTGFDYLSLVPGESALGDALATAGARVWFPEEIISASNSFTQTATSGPGVVDGVPLAGEGTSPGDSPIATKLSLVKPGKLFRFLAKGSFPLPDPDTNDPTETGAALSFHGTSGGRIYALEASGWKGLGPGANGSKGFKFKGDPCTSVVIKPNVIKAVCKPDTGDFGPLPETGPMDIVLTVGADTRYCAQCGGTPKGNPNGIFKRKDCAAPTACP